MNEWFLGLLVVSLLVVGAVILFVVTRRREPNIQTEEPAILHDRHSKTLDFVREKLRRGEITLDEQIELGEKYAEEGNLEESTLLFAAAIRAPKLPAGVQRSDLLKKAASTFLKIHEDELAADVILDFHRDHPTDADGLMLVGELAMNEGHVDLALNYFQRSTLTGSPKRLNGLRGLAHLFKGELTQAKPLLEAEIKAQPDEFDWKLGLALVHAGLSKPELALEQLAQIPWLDLSLRRRLLTRIWKLRLTRASGGTPSKTDVQQLFNESSDLPEELLEAVQLEVIIALRELEDYETLRDGVYLRTGAAWENLKPWAEAGGEPETFPNDSRFAPSHDYSVAVEERRELLDRVPRGRIDLLERLEPLQTPSVAAKAEAQPKSRSSASLEDIEKRSLRQLQETVKSMLGSLGLKVEHLKAREDDPMAADVDGVDAVAKDADDRKVFVQFRRWTGRDVGSVAVQGMLDAIGFGSYDRGLFMVTSHFSDEARALADKSGRLDLWDAERLRTLMRR